MRHSTRFPKKTFAFDLHVLSTPPAFVLSQDQTLQFDILDLSKTGFLQVRARFLNYENLLNAAKRLRWARLLMCCYSVFKDRVPPAHNSRRRGVMSAASSLIYSTQKVLSRAYFCFPLPFQPPVQRAAILKCLLVEVNHFSWAGCLFFQPLAARSGSGLCRKDRGKIQELERRVN